MKERHRLGTTVRGEAFTAEEALMLGHLGAWDVRKVPPTASEISQGRCHDGGGPRLGHGARRPMHHQAREPVDGFGHP